MVWRVDVSFSFIFPLYLDFTYKAFTESFFLCDAGFAPMLFGLWQATATTRVGPLKYALMIELFSTGFKSLAEPWPISFIFKILFNDTTQWMTKMQIVALDQKSKSWKALMLCSGFEPITSCTRWRIKGTDEYIELLQPPLFSTGFVEGFSWGDLPHFEARIEKQTNTEFGICSGFDNLSSK